jgi:poly-gamma-glutamate synthesis protein (capsule biosynthesis protein)
VFFGGDFFTGRYLVPLLKQPDKRSRLVRKIHEVTEGAPLIVNFEGVLLDQCPDDPATKRELLLCLPKKTTLTLMRELGIVAVSLANNHSRDFGDEALAATRRALSEAGIAAVGQGETVRLPQLTLAAFTDLDNNPQPRARILKEADLAPLAAAKEEGRPLAVMLHYGREFAPAPGRREQALVDMLERHGADIIIGVHPHQPGRLTGTPRRIWAWSLGNFLFDQTSREAEGALLELVFFPPGLYWARQRELGNLYKELRGRP